MAHGGSALSKRFSKSDRLLDKQLVESIEKRDLFYEPMSLYQKLICPFCYERFNDPRILSCLHSICYRCTYRAICQELKFIECIKCSKQVEINNDLPKNELLSEILSVAPVKVSRGESYNELRNECFETANNLGLALKSLNKMLNNYDDLVSDHFESIKNQIDLYTEIKKDELDKLRDELLYEIENRQERYKSEDKLAEISKLKSEVLKYVPVIEYWETFSYRADLTESEMENFLEKCQEVRSKTKRTQMFIENLLLFKNDNFRPNQGSLSERSIGSWYN